MRMGIDRRLITGAIALVSAAGVACRTEAAVSAPDNKMDNRIANHASSDAAARSPGAPGAMSDEELRAKKKALPADQYRVTQEEGTEPPFHNAYWDNHNPGIYVDVVSGEPLFSSTEKFESGTGWPSFWAPLEKGNVVSKTDSSLFMQRTEVRSQRANSHLGHLFDDGPKPTGLRYCINSASLRFIPAQRLESEGYGEYARLFPNVKQVSPSSEE